MHSVHSETNIDKNVQCVDWYKKILVLVKCCTSLLFLQSLGKLRRWWQVTSFYFIVCVCRRHDACTDWLILAQHSLGMPASRLRASTPKQKKHLLMTIGIFLISWFWVVQFTRFLSSTSSVSSAIILISCSVSLLVSINSGCSSFNSCCMIDTCQLTATTG